MYGSAIFLNWDELLMFAKFKQFTLNRLTNMLSYDHYDKITIDKF